MTSAMILFANIRPAPDARVPTQANGLARADHRMTRAALVVNRVRVRSLGAQHPVEPYRQFARRRHLGYALWLTVAAMRILLFELFVVSNCRLCRLDQHGAQKHVPLLGNGSQPALLSRAAFRRNQPEIAGHLLAALEPRHVAYGHHKGQG